MSVKKAPVSALATWECRWSSNMFEGHQALIESLKGIAKHYTFQLEEGDGGYKHYQGRISLVKRRRETEKHILLNLFPEGTAPNYLAPTTNPEHQKGDAFYQMKADTRILGPWTDKDEVIYIPRQVREMGDLRPFQQHIVDDADVWDTRHINLVYCPHGNIGKSRLVSYCRAYQKGRALPPVNDYKDLLRMVCDLPTSKLYLFDMPRSLNKDKLYQFFSAVETIKDGYAYDDRYSFKEKVFDCPNIWIFTNTYPDLGMLSFDRWRIWEVDEEYKLNAENIEEKKSQCIVQCPDLVVQPPGLHSL